MKHTLSIAILLSIIWLANSGHYSVLLLVFGFLSIIFVVWLSHKMDVVDNESQPVDITLKLPSYYWWLFIKIVQGNIDVVKRVWSPRLNINPGVATFPVHQKTEMGRVIYANSITLTPGTIAIDIKDSWITVHSLTKESLEEIAQGEMDSKVLKLEK